MTTRLDRHDDPRAAVFVPLAVGFLDDVDVNDCGALAQLVYLRALLHAKRAASDGLVSLRQIAGGLFGHVDPDDVQAAAAELVDAGLWDATSHTDRYVITGWLKHNASTLERSLERDAKRVGAHRTNHKLGRHDGAPVDGCPDCQDGPAPPDPDPPPSVSPGGNAPDAKRDASDSEANAQRGRYSDAETETETETDLQALPVTQEGPAASDASESDSETLSDALGTTQPAEATPVELEIAERLGYPRPPRNAAGIAAACRAAERAGHRRPAIVAAGTADHVRAGPSPAAGAQRAIEALARQQPEPDPMANIAPDSAFPDPTAGWDTPETTQNGLADARAHLAAAHRKRPDQETNP